MIILLIVLSVPRCPPVAWSWRCSKTSFCLDLGTKSCQPPVLAFPSTLLLKRSLPRISSWPHCARKDLYLSERWEISFHSGFCCFSSFWVRANPMSGSRSWLSRICSISHPFNQEWLARSPASNGWACCLVVAWMWITAWSSNFLSGLTVASGPVVAASSATSSVPWQGCGISLAWLCSGFVTGTHDCAAVQWLLVLCRMDMASWTVRQHCCGFFLPYVWPEGHRVDEFKPPSRLTCGCPQIPHPGDCGVVSSEDDFPAVQIGMKIFEGHHNCHELLPGHAVNLLSLGQSFAKVP